MRAHHRKARDWTGIVVAIANLVCSTGAGPSTGCSPNTPPVQEPGVVTTRTLVVTDAIANPTAPHEVTRRYRMLIPQGYQNSVPAALVMDFHGFGQDSAELAGAYGSGFREIAHEHNIVVVWPDGSNDSPSGTQGWNCLGTSAGSGKHGNTCHPDRRAFGEYECFNSCGVEKCKPIEPDNMTHTCLSSSCWDDIGFATKLLDWVEDHVCVDLDHVHLTGFSNGGMMVYQLAHSLSPRIASIAPVAGAPLLGFLEDTVPSTPIAVLDIHGIFDGVIPANVSNGFRGQAGPEGTTWSSDGFYYHPVDQVLDQWATVNACEGPGALREYKTPKDGDMWWHCTEPHGGCRSGASVIRCSSLADHWWPTFYKATCEVEDCPHLDFALLVWDFFQRHPKPSLWTNSSSTPKIKRL